MKLSEIVREAMRVFAPPPDLTCSQWADANRQLSAESSSEPGQWKTHAFQREILDSISNYKVRRVVVKASTQMIKTEAILNGIGYFAHLDPGPILVLQPRDADAKAFSKERIAPMIRDTPVLKAIFTEGKGRTSDNTLDQKMFRGGMLAITSAGSAPNLARRAIRFLFCDEVDKYVPTSEGNAISLARKRLATFRNRSKEIMTCSPTTEGSEIDREYESSDKREYFVPCPECGLKQSMMGKFFTNVTFQDHGTVEERAASARYHCEGCGAEWDDAQRWQAVERGEWRATKPFNGIAGFWISELYSPWKQLKEIVYDFLTKKDKPQEFQTFVNTSLAENWIEKGEAPEWQNLIARREPYMVGTVPMGGVFLTAGVDVQRDRLECIVKAWGRNREHWAIDYQIFTGNPSQPDVWRRLNEYLNLTFTHETGAEMSILKTFVDSGDGTTTNDVYLWARTQPSDRITAIKGDSRSITPVSPLKSVDVKQDGKKISGGLKIKTINVDYFKSELYDQLKLMPPTPEQIAEGFGYPQGYFHHPDANEFGDEYMQQLCSEQLLPHTNRKTGRTKKEWQQLRPRNEALDVNNYARAAAYDLRWHVMQEKHFKALEDQLKAMAHKVEVVNAPAPKQRQGNSWLGDRGKGWFGRQ